MLEQTSSVDGLPQTSRMKLEKRKKSKYAENCMYAELLELSKDDATVVETALPRDLQTNWIALSPIPKGKRCLAVTHSGHGNPSAGKSRLEVFACCD